MTIGVIEFRDDRRPGDDDLIVALHRLGYAQEGDRFGTAFYDFVADTVAEAKLDQPSRSRIWFAEKDGETLGCAAMIDRETRGQLRWVVLRPDARGAGIGQMLVERAMQHARQCSFTSVYLETTDKLEGSMRLYKRLGFQITYCEMNELWHGKGMLIIMEMPLENGDKL